MLALRKLAMHPFARLAAAFSAVLFTVALPAQQTAVLTVQTDKPLHAVSPMLYGLMTEEINYSYDGGLYAEMVRNRTFEKNWMGIQYWLLENAGDSHASLKWEDTTGPSETTGSDAIQSSVAVTVDAADPSHPAGLRNDGWWGMMLRPQTTYTGSFYAMSSGIDSVGVSLISNASGKAVATANVVGVGSAWKQYTFTLKTGDVKPGKDNHLLLTFPHAGKLNLSLVSLFPPTYKGRSNGNRPDLMELMAGMHPKFLRMPGGNYLEGDLIDQRFDWKTTLGPLVDRPTHRGPWNYQSSDGMGLLEFLEWTEDLKIEPVLAVYAGYSLKGDYIHAGPAMQPFIDDAMDEIEFVMGDTSTKWGAVRAKLGHPAPFPLHYVEVGNEDNLDRSGSYESRFPPYYTAIKKKYPQLQVIATAPLKRFPKADVVDDHYYKHAEDFYEMLDHYDKMDRNGPKIFVGEWATREGAPTTDMGAALGDAAWMTSMERNSDLIVMSAYAPLFVNVNPGGMQWESNLIGYDAAGSYGSPSYYAQSMFAEALGTDVPTSSITGANKRFFYSVTRDASKMYLKLVNASTEAQTLDLKLDGATATGEATLVTLHGNSRAETNTIVDPKHLVPVTTRLRGTAITHRTIAPLTVEVLTLPLK
jgi:alpha-N-arabinofuranosidase